MWFQGNMERGHIHINYLYNGCGNKPFKIALTWTLVVELEIFEYGHLTVYIYITK